jgi:hypothetical protein
MDGGARGWARDIWLLPSGDGATTLLCALAMRGLWTAAWIDCCEDTKDDSAMQGRYDH